MKAFTHRFDHQLTKKIQAWPEGWKGVMMAATFVGQPVFTAGTGAMVAGAGFGASNMPLFWAGVIIVETFTLGSILKVLLRRNRPLTDYVLKMRFSTYSLPSGHSVGAVVAYGTLGLLAAKFLPMPLGAIIAALFAVLILAIGLSRIYLGAHYPSDVIAGGLLGLTGLIAIGFVLA
jgi:undecaprenyl-diphosphatase